MVFCEFECDNCPTKFGKTPVQGTLNHGKNRRMTTKVLAIIKSGKTDAAIAQIKVAPSVKDLNQLKAAMIVGGLMAKHKNVEAAVNENLVLLAAPRLHRAP